MHYGPSENREWSLEHTDFSQRRDSERLVHSTCLGEWHSYVLSGTAIISHAARHYCSVVWATWKCIGKCELWLLIKPKRVYRSTSSFQIWNYVGEINKWVQHALLSVAQERPHEGVKYTTFVNFGPPFLISLTRAQGKRDVRSRRLMAQTTWSGARMCLLGVKNCTNNILGVWHP